MSNFVNFDYNKGNPPETAPKDGTRLIGLFDGGYDDDGELPPILMVTYWHTPKPPCPHCSNRRFADRPDWLYAAERDLVSWWPLPEIAKDADVR